MNKKYDSIIGTIGLVCAVGFSMIYFKQKHDEKILNNSLNSLRESLLAREEMNRRVNFYKKESK